MKNKLIANFKLSRKHIGTIGFAMAIAFACMMPGLNVFAAGALIQGIVNMAGRIALIMGAIIGIFGTISFLAANSEGDGPAKHKAQQQIITGILLACGSILLGLVPWGTLVAGM